MDLIARIMINICIRKHIKNSQFNNLIADYDKEQYSNL